VNSDHLSIENQRVSANYPEVTETSGRPM